MDVFTYCLDGKGLLNIQALERFTRENKWTDIYIYISIKPLYNTLKILKQTANTDRWNSLCT